MTNLTIACPVEMGEILVFLALKIMVKSGFEKIFLKFLHVLAIFYKKLIYLIERKVEVKSTNSVIKMTW